MRNRYYKTPSIRRDVVEIQEDILALSMDEIKDLEPEFDARGVIVAWKSPVLVDVTQLDKTGLPLSDKLVSAADTAGHVYRFDAFSWLNQRWDGI